MSMDIVWTLDSTGSMASCRWEATQKILAAAQKLFEIIPDLRIGIIMHGDYCDAHDSYVTKHLPLTNNPEAVYNFLSTTGHTWGGDSPECYELVMAEARELQPWRPDAKKILVMTGDATPHNLTAYLHEYKDRKALDWSRELEKLKEAGIITYAIQCLARREANSFWSAIAASGGTPKLELGQFSNIVEVISAIAFKQAGDEQLNNYATSLFEGQLLNRDLARIIAALQNKNIETEATRMFGDTGLEVVPPSRFQILTVTSEMCTTTKSGRPSIPIKDFITASGAKFQVGRAFYPWTHSETIRVGREIVLVNRASGDMLTGIKARDMLGLPRDRTLTMSPKNMLEKDYDVFIQSTSNNRKLEPGKLLYEVSDD